MVLTIQSPISPPKRIFNKRELLSYFHVKVSGQKNRTLVLQGQQKHELNTFFSLIQELKVKGDLVKTILNLFLEKTKKINQGTVISQSFETDAADQTEVLWMQIFSRHAIT